MEQKKLSTHGCQAKSKNGKDVTSNDSIIGHENSCESPDNEVASSPSPATAEKNAQEIYPWMKEFRSKGTKQDFYFRRFVHVSRKYMRDSQEWAWVGWNPFASWAYFFSDISEFKNQSSEILKDSLDRV